MTGLSYPFILLDGVPHRGDQRKDYHHLEFERRNPLLCGQGGRAVRYSIGQYMLRWQHIVIHRKGGEPDLPVTRQEQFKAAAFGVARLMGPLGLDMRRENWWEPVEMTPEQYSLATDPLRMYVQDAYKPRGIRVRSHIGKFFAQCALEQDLSHVSKRVVREFLRTTDPVRKKELGNWLLAESIDAAVDPIKPVQQELLKRRPVAGRIDLRRAVRGFFVGHQFGKYYGELATRLVDISWA